MALILRASTDDSLAFRYQLLPVLIEVGHKMGHSRVPILCPISFKTRAPNRLTAWPERVRHLERATEIGSFNVFYPARYRPTLSLNVCSFWVGQLGFQVICRGRSKFWPRHVFHSFRRWWWRDWGRNRDGYCGPD